MNSDVPNIFSLTKQPAQLNLQQAFSNFQTHCSGFLQHFFSPDNPSLQCSLTSLQDRAKQVLDAGICRLRSSTGKNPMWARIGEQSIATRKSSLVMSTEAIQERLAGVPVYALSNSNEEFVLVSGASTGKSVGLFCFKKEDAEALLQQMKSMDPTMRREGSKVVPVALNKVFSLKVNGIAFRLIPESTQVKNALKEREKAGFSDDGFTGVPVFQSRSLVLRNENKSYRPVFFRMEDLERSLLRASRQQNKLNPAFKQGDIQVAVFEEVIKRMKEGTASTWDDVVFIPPGFDVSTGASPQQAA